MWGKKRGVDEAGQVPTAAPEVSRAQDSTVATSPQEPVPTDRRQIGEILVASGAITQEQLEQALAAQGVSGRRLGEVLLDLQLAEERHIVAALAHQSGLEVADLAQQAPDSAVANLLPEATARRLRALPIQRDAGGTIVVATSDPYPAALAEVQAALGAATTFQVTTETELQWAMNLTYRALADIESQINRFTSVYGTDSLATQNATIDMVSDEAPVVTIMNRIVIQAMRDRASDIHIEPQSDSIRIRYRIDGVLHEVLRLPASMGAPLVSRVKIMSDLNIVERRRPQDGKTRMEFDGRTVDIRVSTTGVVWGEKVVLRLLDRQGPVIQLHELGMDAATQELFLRDLRSPYGMVVCAGPTGSGKTTTLYSGLQQINSPEVNITTIEEPVEYVFPSLNQIPVSTASGMTFASGLRSILRQDPDVILVGEMRDAETARIGVQAALTGHLVLSSVHATDAVSTVWRFLDMGIERFAVASSLLSVVGQRLIRRVCQDCIAPYTPTIDELAFFSEAGGDPLTDFVRGMGCNYCSRTGYRGRIGVYELLQVDERIRVALVDDEVGREEILELAKKSGMVTLKEQGVRLVQQQETTISEVIRNIYTI